MNQRVLKSTIQSSLRYIFIFMGLHWLLMTLWVLMMRTSFCSSGEGEGRSPRPLSEFVYNIVMAFVLVFDIVDLKDGPTR